MIECVQKSLFFSEKGKIESLFFSEKGKIELFWKEPVAINKN